MADVSVTIGEEPYVLRHLCQHRLASWWESEQTIHLMNNFTLRSESECFSILISAGNHVYAPKTLDCSVVQEAKQHSSIYSDTSWIWMAFLTSAAWCSRAWWLGGEAQDETGVLAHSCPLVGQFCSSGHRDQKVFWSVVWWHLWSKSKNNVKSFCQS